MRIGIYRYQCDASRRKSERNDERHRDRGPDGVFGDDSHCGYFGVVDEATEQS